MSHEVRSAATFPRAQVILVDKGKPVGTPFSEALEAAEPVRLDPSSTPAQLDAQRAIVQRINDTI